MMPSRDPREGEFSQLLLALWVQIEAALKIADYNYSNPLPFESNQHLQDDLATVLGTREMPTQSWDPQRPPVFQNLTIPDVFLRWRNVFREEIDTVQRARNSAAHKLSIAPDDVKAAIGIAARLLAYLRIGLGDPNIETDQLLNTAFQVSGAERPSPGLG